MWAWIVLFACQTVEVPAPDASVVDADGDGWTVEQDCNDQDPTIHPGALELCDAAGLDENCNGLANGADDTVSQEALQAYYVDADGDGYGSDTVTYACDLPAQHAAVAGDCDDSRAEVNPSASEVCDDEDLDEDCNGTADDADVGVDSSSWLTWSIDRDGDGFGSSAQQLVACDPPANSTQAYVQNDSDCDDERADVSPNGTEVCDDEGADEDCDGLVNDADLVDPASASASWPDSDGDGYGDATAVPSLQCGAPPPGEVTNNLDCDDRNAAISPDAREVCDPADVDEDCDGYADNSDPSVDPSGFSNFYVDADQDGHGDRAAPPLQLCDATIGFPAVAPENDDCDDSNAQISPSATERCDGIDNNCNGSIDANDPSIDTAELNSGYPDTDGDGFGVGDLAMGCNMAATADDCDDGNPDVFPGAVELCNDRNDGCSRGWVSDADVTSATLTRNSLAIDVTADLQGTSSAPAALTLEQGDRLSLCGSQTWYASIESIGDTEIEGKGDATLNGGSGRAITHSGGRLDLNRLQVSGGMAAQGGGLHCSDGSVHAVATISGSASVSGGAIYAERCDLVGVQVASSDAPLAGGLHAIECSLEDVWIIDEAGGQTTTVVSDSIVASLAYQGDPTSTDPMLELSNSQLSGTIRFTDTWVATSVPGPAIAIDNSTGSIELYVRSVSTAAEAPVVLSGSTQLTGTTIDTSGNRGALASSLALRDDSHVAGQSVSDQADAVWANGAVYELFANQPFDCSAQTGCQ